MINDLNKKYELLVKNSKTYFYTKSITNSSNPSKTMWGIVNAERGKSNAPKINISEVVKNIDGTVFSTPKEAVDSMNSRFINAALACGAPPADVAAVHSILCSARQPSDRSLRLRMFSADEIFRIVTERIPPKRSKDVYSLSMELIRSAILPLAPVLAELFNKCLREGVYPTSLKVSKVSPIFKGKGTRDDMDAYRPVSIIPAIAKVFENGLSSRLVTYLADTSALSEHQYAYRAGRSTTSMTREVVRRILAARERKQQVAVLCCDLSKAFDVADHQVLGVKLRHYGIVGTPYSVLTDMMRNRSQVVDAGDGCRSDQLSSTMGVAQGSSVSNLLFSLLLNDLPNAVTCADILCYADDVAAIASAPSLDQLEEALNITAANLASWFRANGLVLNLKKTHFVHFVLSGHSRRPLVVSVDGIRIEQVRSTTFLGFHIDRSLTWENHIDTLCGKISAACYALRRVARVVSTEVARACYFATVHSRLQYGAELYASAADWERAFRAQKRAVRAIVGVSRYTSVKPYFKELGILTLPSILVFQVAVYVRNNIGAYSTRDRSGVHNFRNGHRLQSISSSLEKSRKLTHIAGPEVYNRLPDTVRSATSNNIYKLRLKNWLIEQTFYSFEAFLVIK